MRTSPSSRPRTRPAWPLTNGTPTQVLADAGAVSSQFTAVHAIHLDEADFARLGEGRAFCCLCPTTERDLADGIAPGPAPARRRSPALLGSDSNAFIDLFEEARAVELDERLVTNQRGGHSPVELLRAATAEGAESLGWPSGGRIETGRPGGPRRGRARQPAPGRDRRGGGARRGRLLGLARPTCGR